MRNLIKDSGYNSYNYRYIYNRRVNKQTIIKPILNRFSELNTSHDAIYSTEIKIIPWPYRPPWKLPAHFVLLLLADRRDLTGTSQPIARGTLIPP
jgi:hypothetical protein